MMKVLVTGANGFIGHSLCNFLASNSITVARAVRANPASNQIAVGAIDANTQWSDSLSGIDVVIHTAAHVHQMNDDADNSIDYYNVVNVEGTLNLARQAQVAGVKRFIYLSSIKVNGEYSPDSEPFTENSPISPVGRYSQSKAVAEEMLRSLADKMDMEIVIVRPPLVYGAGVKGNFSRLVSLVKRRVPFPFRSIPNKRSMVGIDNLVDFLFTCASHPGAANETFLISDGEDLSTSDLLKRVAGVLQVRIFLVPVPLILLKTAFSIIGKSEINSRLFSSLHVDISKSRRILDWVPKFSVDEGLRSFLQKGDST